MRGWGPRDTRSATPCPSSWGHGCTHTRPHPVPRGGDARARAQPAAVMAATLQQLCVGDTARVSPPRPPPTCSAFRPAGLPGLTSGLAGLRHAGPHSC